MNFNSIKEFKFFGLHAKFQKKLNEPEKLTNELNTLKVIQTRNYVKLLIQNEVKSGLLLEDSQAFHFHNIDEKISILKSELKFNTQDSKYVFHPYYNFQIYDLLNQIFLDISGLNEYAEHFAKNKWAIFYEPDTRLLKPKFTLDDVNSVRGILKTGDCLTTDIEKKLKECDNIIKTHLL